METQQLLINSRKKRNVLQQRQLWLVRFHTGQSELRSLLILCDHEMETENDTSKLN